MIRQIKKSEINSYNKLATHPIQSWEWGEFRKQSGNIPYRFGVFEKNKLLKNYMLLGHRVPKTNLKIGTIIKGPKLNTSDLQFLTNFAKDEGFIFIKIEPKQKDGESTQ